MITRKTSLWVLALLIGICAAVSGNAFAPTPAYVKVRFCGATNFVCVNSNINCNQMTSTMCFINVVTTLGTKSVLAHPNSSCTGTLTHSVGLAGTYNPGNICDATD